ncbi:leucine-rich repeat domain-containing protein [Flavilitoribacter nigricans]|uniref:Leucine-rich repeat domain-containing protein n=1 Tax=Flavilitoribacter nigricans (strain ATCC 23147 / DSM 23189 / NBRC 102662 / NCIMB 1420 / SS-2) TaxID=1122177 RepID=A0A2D0N4Q9_FLAN2|nr:leucine-rich repeat domain-containing protein [Flavilitoribacter nigricans]PHN03522.1 hypothetical protein CRP01_26340 [Flavilitoribacter nigricans DSM 23189 = NBRC 102662]
MHPNRKKYHESHRDQKRLAYGTESEPDTEPVQKQRICHEGPYCQVCHDSGILPHYLTSRTYCRGIILEKQVLSHKLLAELGAASLETGRLRWLILNKAYAGTQQTSNSQPASFRDFSTLFQHPGMQHLEQLAIISQEFNDNDLHLLATSSYIRHLKELILPFNRITNAGVDILMQHPQFQKLQVLDLSYNQFDELQLDPLLGSRFLPQLEELYLAGNTSLFLNRYLALKSSLKLLDISGNNVSLDQFNSFIRKNPDIHLGGSRLANGYPPRIASWFNDEEAEDFWGWVGSYF